MSKRPARRSLVPSDGRRPTTVQSRYFGENETFRNGHHRTFQNGFYHAAGKNGRQQVEEAVDLLYRQKYVILGLFLIGVIVAALIALPARPVYQASAFVRLEPTRMGQGRDASTPETFGDFGSADELGLFMQSQRPVEEELLLVQLASPLAQRVAVRLQEMEGTPATEEDLPVQAVAARIARQVSLLPELGTYNIIRVTARSTDPQEAALLANLFAEEYEHLTQEASRRGTDSAREYIEQLEQQKLAELRRAEAELRTYMNEAGAAALDETGGQLVSQMAQVRAQRDEYLIDLDMRKEALQSIESRLQEFDATLTRSITSNTEEDIASTSARVDELLEEKRVIERTFSEGRKPPVVEQRLAEIDRDVQALRAEIERLASNYVDQARTIGGTTGVGAVTRLAELEARADQERKAIERLQAQIDLLNVRLGEYRDEYDQIPGASMTLAELERSRIYAERMYQYVRERALELNLSGERGGYAQMLHAASVPLLPLPGGTSRTLLLGALLGLLAGLGVGVVRDKLDNRIRKPDELLARGHAAIGVIPDMHRLIKEDYSGQSFVEHEGRSLSSSMVTLLSPTSSAAEAYRPLGMRIRFGSPAENVRTLLITSSGLGEGKSVTSANLGVTMAKGGRRTLVLDADLRRPYQYTLFGLDNERGLIQMLRGQIALDTAPISAVTDDLWVLPSGGVADNSAELLGSPRMAQLLGMLEDHFDFIVVDSPPLRAVTDAALLAVHCDATLLVARAGKTKEKELEYSLGVLGGVGVGVIGTVLNGFDLSMAYGYSYSYQHVTKYGPFAKYGY